MFLPQLLQIWRFPEIVVLLNHPNFHGLFPYKPTILRSPFKKPPHLQMFPVFSPRLSDVPQHLFHRLHLPCSQRIPEELRFVLHEEVRVPAPHFATLHGETEWEGMEMQQRMVS